MEKSRKSKGGIAASKINLAKGQQYFVKLGNASGNKRRSYKQIILLEHWHLPLKGRVHICSVKGKWHSAVWRYSEKGKIYNKYLGTCTSKGFNR